MRETNPISMEKRINNIEVNKADSADVEQLNDDMLDIIDQLNPSAYISEGLTYDNCTYIKGGYVKIGKLVIVNIRIAVDDTGASVSGFPTYFNKSNINIVSCSVMGTGSSIAYKGYISQDGKLTIENVLANSNYVISASYIAD